MKQEQKVLVLNAIDYDKMAYCTSKYVVKAADGVWKEETYDSVYGQTSVTVTKNLTGPTFTVGAEAGLFKIHSG